jgi:hypothetical protein
MRVHTRLLYVRLAHAATVQNKHGSNTLYYINFHSTLSLNNYVFFDVIM